MIVAASGQAGVVTGIWPGSPSRRWRIELTEGPTEHSANKTNEKKTRTMKKILAAAGLGAAVALGSLAGAGTASASDGFLDAVHDAGFYTASGSNTSLIYNGNQVCNFGNLGYSEYAIQNWVYLHTGPSIGWADAGQFVAIAEDYMC